MGKMKYTQVPAEMCQEIQLNSGLLTDTFNPEEATSATPFALSSGGLKFSAMPKFIDYGADIDGCPEGSVEMQDLDKYEVKMSGTFVTISTGSAQRLIPTAELAMNKVTARNHLEAKDYKDLWFVGDYTFKNGGSNGGFIAIHMLNTLSTGGFSMQTTDKNKGQFAFEFTAHPSLASQDTVPFELYIQSGSPA